jgi:hypothetical protein
MLTGREYVAVWSTPFRVRLNEGVPLPATESVAPAATVAFTVTGAADAVAASAADAAHTTRMRNELRMLTPNYRRPAEHP